MEEQPRLTERQRQVLEFIEDRIEAWGYPPTIREIGAHLGIRSTNGVADHLKALKRKGYLTQRGLKSRTLIPTRPGAPTASVEVPPKVVPAVLGGGRRCVFPSWVALRRASPSLPKRTLKGRWW